MTLEITTERIKVTYLSECKKVIEKNDLDYELK